jgi:GNAT superfamily N-acetyltransferase
VFQHQAFTCVRVPPTLYGQLQEAISSQDRAILLAPEWWLEALPTIEQRTFGAAYLGYADALGFRPVIRHPTRMVSPVDSAALEQFASAVGQVAWEHSGLGEQPQPIAGCWQEDRLVAAAGYTVWGGALAHIGVTTDPAARGAGYGRSVVSAIGQHALEHGYVLQYRTLLANHPSLAIAAAVGMQAYATTLFLNLDAELGR